MQAEPSEIHESLRYVNEQEEYDNEKEKKTKGEKDNKENAMLAHHDKKRRTDVDDSFMEAWTARMRFVRRRELERCWF